jgi:hypothetical protein
MGDDARTALGRQNAVIGERVQVMRQIGGLQGGTAAVVKSVCD